MSSQDDFAEFYSVTFARLTAQLYAYTGDHAEAQDMVQEALCRAYTRWDSISTYADPAGWVRRVAWNMAISRWRRARRLLSWHRELLSEDVTGPSGAPIDLARALAKLSADHRQAIVLHYLADMSVKEIADFTGAAEGTVKAWLHRGRTALGKLLTDPADFESSDLPGESSGEVANV
ncbi:RNA polymerase sigma-70 factor (ECF subfamily) [Allocatelliglobosispora scoriae]|uniref:RNA polymerase sigma-70 factor (ECF subfamily) n=1 Tax=Allocatelliglobosispora scoriae TaxID=643052 RepID=A0A841BWJ8_9ACTN|nr:SigE family RNA polymerase sigma factor [Allocatelliglobosispora scoriae]MBB5871101.1 RNA polymerase sigma-70 factor (ECF subfamily) [Allocatelliglobosispora scoriae]